MLNILNKIILALSTLLITTSSIADTSKIKSNFFSSIESFLNDNFENTNVSIKIYRRVKTSNWNFNS